MNVSRGTAATPFGPLRDRHRNQTAGNKTNRSSRDGEREPRSSDQIGTRNPRSARTIGSPVDARLRSVWHAASGDFLRLMRARRRKVCWPGAAAQSCRAAHNPEQARPIWPVLVWLSKSGPSGPTRRAVPIEEDFATSPVRPAAGRLSQLRGRDGDLINSEFYDDFGGRAERLELPARHRIR
jgi:hypothetical protein